MHHRTRCRRTEIGLQVRRMVVHQRAHALAALHSQPLQALRKPSRTLVEIAVRVSLDIAVPAPPRDLHSRKQPPRTLQDASQRQLERHHRAPHAASSSVVLLGPRILPRICRCPIYDPHSPVTGCFSITTRCDLRHGPTFTKALRSWLSETLPQRKEVANG